MSHDVLRENGVDPDESDTFARFNTWQPFDHPAINNPLAFIDNSSLADDDVIDYFLRAEEEIVWYISSTTRHTDGSIFQKCNLTKLLF